MIDPNVFRVSREAARAKLHPAVARESFGYYIDVLNDWESYRSPDELIYYLGIHKTHESQFPQIINDLGPLTPAERDWAKRYVRFYDRLARLLTTNDTRTPLQFDLAETIFDWRTILGFVDLPARILDYGAGCGRQCISAFLRHPGNIYAAVDSTLAAYTVQNMVFSFMDALGAPGRFVDLLDAQTIGNKSRPSIAQAAPGSRFHVPAWFETEPLPERFFDVILACHVHNELSGSDFRRLIAAVDKCLADDGIFYVRSELGVRFPKNYFDTVDMHAIDPVRLLATKGIVPVRCVYACAFQTTVFARLGSRHHAAAKASARPENQFFDITDSFEATVRAGRHYTLGVLDWLVESRKRTALCGAGADMYEKLVASNVNRMRERIVFDESESVAGGDRFKRKLARFDPEVVVCAGNSFPVIERNVREALGGDFKIKLHQVMPITFLCREMQHKPDPILTADIRAAGDIERVLGEPARARAAEGAGIFDRL